MKILIVGNGDTAVHLAQMLSRENQDVVVMGTDANVLTELDLHCNVITQAGRAVSVSALRNAGAPDCDLCIAVTPFENHNLISCEIAHWLGAHTTIARIDNAELLDEDARRHFVTLGVDSLVYPELIAANEIADSVEYVWMRARHLLADGEICVCSVKIDSDASVAGLDLKEFGQRTAHFHVPLIMRRGVAIIPGGSHGFEPGDVAYFAFLPGHEAELAALCGKKNRRIGRVLISGAGKMADTVAPRLAAMGYPVKVIDADRDRCERFADLHSHVTVVNADPRSIDTLREEGIRDNCAFIALGDSSETNIVSATVAKHLGAVKTIADIEDTQYFDEARQLDIDTVVNKKLLTSSRIYQRLLDDYLDSPRCLAFEDTEVVETQAREGSAITQRPVRDLRLPPQMTIAGLRRGNRGMLVNGNTRIEPGDRVVTFCQRGEIRRVEKLFS